MFVIFISIIYATGICNHYFTSVHLCRNHIFILQYLYDIIALITIQEKIMFTSKEIRLCSVPYFNIIQICDIYIELQSNNTGHCWIIQKCNGTVQLHHKRNSQDPYYHKQKRVFTVSKAIAAIMAHDEYVLKTDP